MDGESNESMHNKYGMSSRCEGMEDRVIERVQRRTRRWFGHIEGMPGNEMTENIDE